MRPLMVFFLFSCAASAQILSGGSIGGGGGGGGAYSQASASYPVGTYFLPPGGNLAPNAIRTNVTGLAPVTGSLANLTVQLGTAPGGGNSLAFTFMDGAIAEPLTCTVSASATNCTDYTHSFAAAQGDALSIQMVVAGATYTGAITIIQWALPGVPGAAGATGSAGANGTNGNFSPTAINSQSGTSYTFVNADCSKEVRFSNASPVAVTLPQAGSGGNFAALCSIMALNNGAGTVTITPTTSTLGGASSQTLSQGQSAAIISDGTNYDWLPGKGTGGGGITQLTGDVTAGPGSGSQAATLANSGVSAGSCGDTTHSCGLTIDIKGRITAQSNNAITSGTGNAAAIVTLAFSATPTFTCPSATAGTVVDFQAVSNAPVVLTGNVTSSTLATCTGGSVLNFLLKQDATGGRTVAMPSGFDAPLVHPAANATTKLTYYYDGANGRLLSSFSDAGYSAVTEVAAPGTPPAGIEYCWADSTRNTWTCKNSAGNNHIAPRTAQTGDQLGFGDLLGTTNVRTNTCLVDNDTQSATALTAAQFSGKCTVPVAATIVEVDLIGGTGTINGTAAAPTVSGTSSVQIGKYTPNGGASTTGLMSALVATTGGKACVLTSATGTCLNGNTSVSATVTTTSISAGDVLYVSAATADAAQTWYQVAIIYTVN